MAPTKNHNDLADDTDNIMFTFSKMPSKIMANTLRNNICLQKFLPVWASTGVLSNAHIESASPGKSTVWGFPAVTRSHYRNKSCAFLFKKNLTWPQTTVKIVSILSNKHHKRNFLPSLVPWRQKSQCILFRDWKEMCTQAFPTLSRRTNLASGSLAGNGMNVQFFDFFLQSVFLFEFMYDWFHSLGFGLLVSHNSFLEWPGIEINCIWVANGSWLDKLDTVRGERKNCSQNGVQDKWLYSSNCLLNLHRFILVQHAWEENSVVKIHCSLMKTCFPCKTID